MAKGTGLRIPRMALVTLTLGGACGGGDDGNVNEARVRSVSRALCEQSEECGGLDGESVEDCVDSYAEDMEALLEEDGKRCGDAALDYYACYAKFECDEEDASDCEDLYDRMLDACPSLAGDE